MSFRNQLTAAGLIMAMGAAGVVALLPQGGAGAQADQYERILVGVRLNSKANAVLRSFGNPNDVVVGDVGIREAPSSGQSGTGAPGGAGGFGSPGGPAMGGGMARGGGMSRGGTSFGANGPGGGAGFPGGATMGGGGGGATAPAGGLTPSRGSEDSGFGGSSTGFPGGGMMGSPGGGYPGGGYPGGGMGGSVGGGTGQFGQTVSTLTPQQETTWIYNRRAGKDVVSYEFLVGQGGAVTQIRAIGYSGGNVKTRKGVVLGSTYKEVVQKYGYPEEQFRVGRSLIASYKANNHVLFQFLNQRGQSENPFSAGNKVIAITIASVE